MSVGTLTDIALEKGGGVWDYVSASRLNLWLKCPLAFKLRYIDGIRSPTTPALFVGKQTHDALEVYYRNLQLGNIVSTDDVVRHVFESWEAAIAQEDAKFDSVDASCASMQQTANLVRAYLEHVADEPVKPLAVETSLEYELIDTSTGENLGIPLLGVVDLVHDQGQGPVVCDFKTASRSSATVDVMHEIQLSCYSYLFRQTSGVDEAGLEIRSLIKTKTPKIECHSFETRGASHFRRLFVVIRAYLDDLDSRRFVYRPSLGCSMCDFRDSHCRSWNGVGM